RGPEAGLADAVPFPDAERGGFEALEQRRHAAGHATVDAQFVDHGDVRWLVVGGSVAARGGAIYTNRGPSTTGSVARMKRRELRERRAHRAGRLRGRSRIALRSMRAAQIPRGSARCTTPAGSAPPPLPRRRRTAGAARMAAI